FLLIHQAIPYLGNSNLFGYISLQNSQLKIHLEIFQQLLVLPDCYHYLPLHLMSLDLILHKLLEQELKKLLIMPLYKFSFTMLPSIFLLFYTFLRAKSFMSKKEDNLPLKRDHLPYFRIKDICPSKIILIKFFTFFPLPVILMSHQIPLQFLDFSYMLVNLQHM